MAQSHALILSAGGVRSLVALAVLAAEEPRPRITVLTIRDGRAAGPSRIDHTRKQCEAYQADKRLRLGMPQLYGVVGESAATAGSVTPGETGAMPQAQVLLTAVAQARLYKASRVIYAGNFGDDEQALAHANERLMLIEHLGAVEAEANREETEPVVVEAPLLELSDQQVIELGAQMNVDWMLAWSCKARGEHPCGRCAGCKRRRAAFARAGLLDPQDLPPAPIPA